VGCRNSIHTLREQLETNYPEELREAALIRACFGGEFHYDTMNLVEKMIIRKVAKVKADVSEIREETISAFAHTMNDSREVIEQN
jgi:menaquinone-dependent protoporphyrinogen oxidase